jgi:hypothetical protein
MTDPDGLDCKIHELKEVQRVAWRQLADPSLTTFERREARNQIRLSNSELRQYLQMMSERLRFRVRSAEEDAGRFGDRIYGFSPWMSHQSKSSSLKEGHDRFLRSPAAPRSHEADFQPVSPALRHSRISCVGGRPAVRPGPT